MIDHRRMGRGDPLGVERLTRVIGGIVPEKAIGQKTIEPPVVLTDQTFDSYDLTPSLEVMGQKGPAPLIISLRTPARGSRGGPPQRTPHISAS